MQVIVGNIAARRGIAKSATNRRFISLFLRPACPHICSYLPQFGPILDLSGCGWIEPASGHISTPSKAQVKYGNDGFPGKIHNGADQVWLWLPPEKRQVQKQARRK
jgi:hypothetical protein